jgi:hypothetical protein
MLYFAVAIHKHLKAVDGEMADMGGRREIGLIWAFADDIRIAAAQRIMGTLFASLKEKLGASHLKIKISKCKLLLPSSEPVMVHTQQQSDESNATTSNLNHNLSPNHNLNLNLNHNPNLDLNLNLNLAHATPHTSTHMATNMDTESYQGLPADIEVNRRGIKSMGVPIGCRSYIASYLHKYAHSHESDIEAISLLQPSSAFALLTKCINTRPNYLKRAVARDPSFNSAFEIFDDRIDAALRSILKRSVQLSTADKIARRLPTELGWLGVYDHGGHRGEINAIRSEILTHTHIQASYPHLRSFTINALDALKDNEFVSENEVIMGNADDDTTRHLTNPPSNNFATLLDMIAERDKSEMVRMRMDEGDWQAVAWATSQHSWECGSWLRDCSYQPHPFPASHTAYTNTINLLLSTQPPSDTCMYCACALKINIISNPWHCLDCNSSHSIRTRCHKKLVQILAGFLSQFGTVTTSPTIYLNGTTRVGDLKFFHLITRIPYFIDVSTTNPSAPTYNNITTCTQPRRAAELRENEKLVHYQGTEHTTSGENIIPFVIECSGRVGEIASQFLSTVSIDKKAPRKLLSKFSKEIAFSNGECLAICRMYGGSNGNFGGGGEGGGPRPATTCNDTTGQLAGHGLTHLSPDTNIGTVRQELNILPMDGNDLTPIGQAPRGAVSLSHDHMNIDLNPVGTETLHPNIRISLTPIRTIEPPHPLEIPRTSLHTARTPQKDQPHGA